MLYRAAPGRAEPPRRSPSSLGPGSRCLHPTREHPRPRRESESENAPSALHASSSSRATASSAPSTGPEHKGHGRGAATCGRGKCPIHSRAPGSPGKGSRGSIGGSVRGSFCFPQKWGRPAHPHRLHLGSPRRCQQPPAAPALTDGGNPGGLLVGWIFFVPREHPHLRPLCRSVPSTSGPGILGTTGVENQHADSNRAPSWEGTEVTTCVRPSA